MTTYDAMFVCRWFSSLLFSLARSLGYYSFPFLTKSIYFSSLLNFELHVMIHVHNVGVEG